MAVSAPGPQLLRWHGGADGAHLGRAADGDHNQYLLNQLHQLHAEGLRRDVNLMAHDTAPVTHLRAAGDGATSSSQRRRARTRRTAVRMAQLQGLGLRLSLAPAHQQVRPPPGLEEEIPLCSGAPGHTLEQADQVCSAGEGRSEPDALRQDGVGDDGHRDEDRPEHEDPQHEQEGREQSLQQERSEDGGGDHLRRRDPEDERDAPKAPQQEDRADSEQSDSEDVDYAEALREDDRIFNSPDYDLDILRSAIASSLADWAELRDEEPLEAAYWKARARLAQSALRARSAAPIVVVPESRDGDGERPHREDEQAEPEPPRDEQGATAETHEVELVEMSLKPIVRMPLDPKDIVIYRKTTTLAEVRTAATCVRTIPNKIEPAKKAVNVATLTSHPVVMGSAVEVRGQVSNPINGIAGRDVAWDSAARMYQVLLVTGSAAWLRPSSLNLIGYD